MAAIDWSEGLCTSLPMDEAVDIFYPLTGAGVVVRTAPWPKPDRHEAARRYCPRCPLVVECLLAALDDDVCTFRVLSPEERAALGGARAKPNRERAPYLSVEQVFARIADSGYPDSVWQALIGWDEAVTAVRVERIGAWPHASGWSVLIPASEAVRDVWVDAIT